MKWLLLSLILINAVLYFVNQKGAQGEAEEYKRVVGASEIRLLAEEMMLSALSSERCLVLSGFKNRAELDSARTYLEGLGLNFKQIDKEELLASVYRVYVVPNGLMSEVQEKLKVNGIESYEIMDGELKGNLSVGLFENIDLARALIKRLQMIQLDADLYERKKIKNMAALEIKMSEIADKSQLLQGLKESEIKMAEIREFFCKSIASEK